MRLSKCALLFAALITLDSSLAMADPISDRITVTVQGKGPDVILIPGLACSTAVWDATVAHLAGHYRLHLVQVAGFAGAPARANAQGLVVQPTVDAIDAYIKTNHLKSPKIIGHSLGGTMGLMLAIQHPEDVDKLMLVDSLPFTGTLMGAPDAASAIPMATMMRDNLLNQTQDAYAQGETNFLHSLVKSPAGLRSATAWAVASDKSVVARALYEDMTMDLRSKLPEVKTPVTMLYPWDAITGVSQTVFDGMYQSSYAPLPHKTITRIDGSLHFITFDQPDLFVAQVDTFLK
jgi:pimeloyl-ACP methyl ester carboxylesterase